MSPITPPLFPEDDYTYCNTCVECGHPFQSSDMYAQLCDPCLTTLGLHIEDGDNDPEY